MRKVRDVRKLGALVISAVLVLATAGAGNAAPMHGGGGGGHVGGGHVGGGGHFAGGHAGAAGHGFRGGHGFSGHGGHFNHFHGGFRGGVIIGAPLFWPYYYPYTYDPYVYDPPTTYVAPAPPTYWYYCQSAGGYYPTVPACPEPWVQVPAQ
jgi:hypothetical protein